MDRGYPPANLFFAFDWWLARQIYARLLQVGKMEPLYKFVVFTKASLALQWQVAWSHFACCQFVAHARAWSDTHVFHRHCEVVSTNIESHLTGREMFKLRASADCLHGLSDPVLQLVQAVEGSTRKDVCSCLIAMY